MEENKKIKNTYESEYSVLEYFLFTLKNYIYQKIWYNINIKNL